VNRVWNFNISSVTDIRLVNPPFWYGKGHSADQVLKEKQNNLSYQHSVHPREDIVNQFSMNNKVYIQYQ